MVKIQNIRNKKKILKVFKMKKKFVIYEGILLILLDVGRNRVMFKDLRRIVCFMKLLIKGQGKIGSFLDM